MATTNQEFVDQVAVAAGDIAEALQGHHHRAALAALLRVYVEVALASPCCLQAATADAMSIGAHLLSHGPGTSGAIH